MQFGKLARPFQAGCVTDNPSPDRGRDREGRAKQCFPKRIGMQIVQVGNVFPSDRLREWVVGMVAEIAKVLQTLSGALVERLMEETIEVVYALQHATTPPYPDQYNPRDL